MEHAGGDEMLYLAEIGTISEADLGVRKVCSQPGFPTKKCREWLDDLGSIHPSMLGEARALDFREITLPLIANPDKIADYLVNDQMFSGFPAPRSTVTPQQLLRGCGTFDPMLTARLSSQMALKEIHQSRQPFEGYKAVHSPAKPIPEFRGGPFKPGIRLKWEQLKFRFQMNNSPNTLGRYMLGLGENPEFGAMLKAKCAVEARREETRILLASILYRHKHGALPHKLSDLVPDLLPAVPTDPYTGKPIAYDPTKGTIGSVPTSATEMFHEAFEDLVDIRSVQVQIPKGR
jgi:hypothetical protein